MSFSFPSSLKSLSDPPSLQDKILIPSRAHILSDLFRVISHHSHQPWSWPHWASRIDEVFISVAFITRGLHLSLLLLLLFFFIYVHVLSFSPSSALCQQDPRRSSTAQVDTSSLWLFLPSLFHCLSSVLPQHHSLISVIALITYVLFLSIC